MSVVSWCACHGITKAKYYYRLCCVKEACLDSLQKEMSAQQFRWLMEGLTIVLKKSVKPAKPLEYMG